MRRGLNQTTIVFLIIMLGLAVTNGAFNDPLGWLMDKALILPGIIIALSFHEFAHAAVAYKLGDQTPKFQGRVTVNPAAHIDPVGLMALFFVGFGWGRPVEVNPRAFKKPRRDEILVSAAGVTMNFILAAIFMLVYRLYYQFAGEFVMSYMGNIVSIIIMNIISINVVLMIFNLLPVPPLDGFNIITEVFRLQNTKFYYAVYDKGFFILMILIIFNITDMILTPLVGLVLNLLMAIFF